MTLDGLHYTFNGLGDYRLIDVGEELWELHGRAVRPVLPVGGLAAGTVFSAFAAKGYTTAIVHIGLSDDFSRKLQKWNGMAGHGLGG